MVLIFACMPVMQAHAQLLGSTDALTISVSPQYPRPHDTVTVTPRSTSLNLAAGTVTISANGSIIEQGSGGRSASVTLGGPGSSTTIKVTAVVGGITYTSEVTLRPTDVALVLEPQTTTHPLYAGAALVAPEGNVRIVAIPDFHSSNGTRLAPSSLVYTWKLSNRILTEDSGIGRSVLTARAPARYRNADVSVTVTTKDETVVGSASISVAPASPAVYAYRSDPLLGLDFSHAISGAFALTNEEETFRAIPLNFSTAPEISWMLDGKAAGSNERLTVRTTSDNAGSASVGITALEPAGESAKTAFTVNFKARRSGTLFGF